jgi:protein-S-isoprenylcysteine O-methyltransferase Ste14
VTDPSRSGPGVRYPPPLLFVLGIVLGWWLDRAMPLPLAGPAARWRAVGWALVAFGISLTTWAVATFRGARTSIIPNRPATTLVTHGPFRLSRNPMYLALTLLYLGMVLLLNSAWPLLLLPLVITVLQWTVIRPEEHYLAARFGVSYAEYWRRVRRWL